MYLSYNEFLDMGGTLDETAFKLHCRKAEYIINAQAGGMTGARISRLAELPQAVKDCTFELVMHLAQNSTSGARVQSESQSLGGQSENITYTHMSKAEADAQTEDIINTYLLPVMNGGISLLYRGAEL